MARAMAAVFAAASLASLSGASAADGREMCDFDNVPLFPGFFWDPNCTMGEVGCNADGKNVECRFCGGGEYSTPCPSSSCYFPGGEPSVPYFWDESCKLGGLGCWADGVHAQCRYCGDHPFTSIPCPTRGVSKSRAGCSFDVEPVMPYFSDPSCVQGAPGLGCLADGKTLMCRFCGEGEFAGIPCPSKKNCSFAAEPSIPYFWDESCASGGLGCNADGVHMQCRFCAARPFESVPCPEDAAPPLTKCSFPPESEPSMPYYWEPKCKAGILGCWADGFHAECRFCGEGVFKDIPCSSSREAAAGASSQMEAGMALVWADSEEVAPGTGVSSSGSSEESGPGPSAERSVDVSPGREKDIDLSGSERRTRGAVAILAALWASCSLVPGWLASGM